MGSACKPALLVLTACTVLTSALHAQNIKTLDLRTQRLQPQHARKSFYVILAARGGSATGHAFVLWGIEDSVRRRTTIQAFGLYPDGSRRNCSSLVRTVPGGISDEMKNHSFQAITEELIVRVDEADFKRSWRVARQWDCRHEDSMLNRDCVEFLRAVGESIHLDMPRRAITRWTPQAYVRGLLASSVNRPPAVFP
jgi:hypothetical protein